MISVKEVDSKNELLKFVKFPFELYKNSKFWVPPIINQEIENFDKEKNPNIKQSKTNLFLAYNGSEVVGRIVAIINNYEVEVTKIKKIRFGWFDFIDDFEVSKKLLNKIEEIGKQNSLDFVEGPMGFTNLDKVGVLTSGFDKIGTMITTYNHEKIHLVQQRELWVVGFYLLYVWYWLKAKSKGLTGSEAYYAIPFEKEAYENERRKHGKPKSGNFVYPELIVFHI